MVTPGFIPVLVSHPSQVLAPVLVPHRSPEPAPSLRAGPMTRSKSPEPAPSLGVSPCPWLKPTGYKIGHASGIKAALGI